MEKLLPSCCCNWIVCETNIVISMLNHLKHGNNYTISIIKATLATPVFSQVDGDANTGVSDPLPKSVYLLVGFMQSQYLKWLTLVQINT